MNIAFPRESFAASVALRERALVVTQIDRLAREPDTSWRNREIGELRIFLREVDGMIAHHRREADGHQRAV